MQKREGEIRLDPPACALHSGLPKHICQRMPPRKPRRQSLFSESAAGGQVCSSQAQQRWREVPKLKEQTFPYLSHQHLVQGRLARLVNIEMI